MIARESIQDRKSTGCSCDDGNVWAVMYWQPVARSWRSRWPGSVIRSATAEQLQVTGQVALSDNEHGSINNLTKASCDPFPPPQFVLKCTGAHLRMTAQILASELGNLIQDSKRKNTELKSAAEKSLQDLRSLPITSEAQLVAGMWCKRNLEFIMLISKRLVAPATFYLAIPHRLQHSQCQICVYGHR